MMQRLSRSVSLNNRGVSLVEVLIAMIIIMVVLLSLVQTTLLSIDGNLRNVLRDEAVRIAEQTMGDLRNYPFDNAALNPGTTCAVVTRNLRNITAKDYNICRVISTVPGNADTKILQVVVGWNHKNENALKPTTNREFEHYITSIMRKTYG
jgi:Tfp pilus assembly protein PilV